MNIKRFGEFQLVNEARFEDVYGSEFVRFRNKYTELIESGKLKRPDKLYVQFSNLKDNTLDKSIHQTPDHADPAGLYAYPLSYVLEHPSDIWYGSSARNMRIIKDKTKSKLVLTAIRSGASLNKALANIGIAQEDIKGLVKLAKQYYPNRFEGTSKFGKLFMTILQMDLEKGKVKTGEYKEPLIQVFSAVEQSKRLLTGYDAIEDCSAHIDDAIINDREPEQVCFLTRKAFEIVEVYHLHRDDKRSSNIVVGTPNPRKLVAQLATAMNDRITDSDEKAFKNGGIYWTTKGRRIELSVDVRSDYRDELKMGQKHHRYAKEHDHHELRGTVFTEYGDIHVSDEKGSMSYAEIVDDFVWSFENAQKKGERAGWAFDSRAEHLKRLKATKDAENEIYWAKKRKENIVEFTGHVMNLKKWADLMGMAYAVIDSEEAVYQVGEGISYIMSEFYNRHKPVEEVLQKMAGYFDPYDTIVERYTREGKLNELHFIQRSEEVMRQIYTRYPYVGAKSYEARYRFQTQDTGVKKPE